METITTSLSFKLLSRSSEDEVYVSLVSLPDLSTGVFFSATSFGTDDIDDDDDVDVDVDDVDDVGISLLMEFT